VLPEVTLNYISLGNLLYAILTSSSILLYFAVTADRRQRLLTAELASRKQMIADLSHEMKTPIAAMLARTQLEIMNREPEPQASRVAGATPWAVIERNLQAMRRLANRMLDLTRLEGGHRVVEPREVDAGEIARQAVEVVRPLADEKNLRLELEMPDAAQAKVVADPDLLSTVLRNLLSNAVRHSRDGGRVLIRGSREQGEHAAPQGFLLEVRDEGEGIAPEILPHIFDPFYRGDAGRSREKGHHGLGLSIARRAVEQMGGQISASSVPGEGATFFVRL
jgi:signal transduction histidine kinase